MASLNLPLPPSADTARRVEIRHVRTQEEFAACVALQHMTWGAAFNEAVPASMLKITQRLGGVTAGAFAEDGALLGFVFGITGVEHGVLVHWSDMLAVREDAQSLGVGRQLKEFQRDALRGTGVTRMYWTFDPLVARNAHFNLNRLGAQVFEYVPDMYGSNTGSVLHSGFGTDRFIVTWPIGAAADVNAEAALAEHFVDPASSDSTSALVLNAMFDGDDGSAVGLDATPPAFLRVEIPSDIFRVNEASPSRARRWRETTRRAFQWALAHGYRVDGFERGGSPTGHSAYLLGRPER